jgi:hypothetical protein
MMMRLLRLSGKIFTAGRREKGGQNTREKIGNFQKQNKTNNERKKKKKTLVEKKFLAFTPGL